MRTSSAKAKGRRLCAYIRERLLWYAPDLQEGDIKVPAGSQPGEDIWLSPAARAVYPLAIEAKNQEALNIWAALKQSEEHAVGTDNKPVVIFSRNRCEKKYIAMDLEDFMKLVR